MPAPRTLIRLQRLSALVFAGFLAVHLAAVAASLGGEAAFDRAVALSRYLYRWLPVELALAAAVAVHAYASVVLWWRRPDGLKRPLTAEIQTYAGFVMLAFIVGHVGFLRVAPAWYGFEADYLYLWTAFEIWPTLFVPYYLLLAAAGAFHLAYGIRLYLAKGPEKNVQRALYAALTIFFLVVAFKLPRIEPAARPTDAELKQYLRPFETFTPWLIDMGEEHPYVRRYLGKPPLER